MKPWTIGLSTGCFYQHRITGVIDEIRHNEFEAVEVCSFPKHLDYQNQDDVRSVGRQLRQLGLRPVLFHAPFADRIDITSLNANDRADAVRELVTACEAAAAMEVENVVLHPGPKRAGRPPEAEFQLRMHHAADPLNIVADRCFGLGVRLVLENMLPHLLFGHVNGMMYLLGSIRSCEVSTCLDTGHAFLGRELALIIHKLSGHLHLVHVNDNRGDWDDHLAPGEGHIDWLWVLRELQRYQFSGTLILELSLREHEPVVSMLERARAAHYFPVDLMRHMD